MQLGNVLFWAGDYEIGPDKWSGSGLRGLQVCRALIAAGGGQLGVFSSTAQTMVHDATVLTSVSDGLEWADTIYTLDNVPAQVVRDAASAGITIVAENHTPIEHLLYQGLDYESRRALHHKAVATYSAQLAYADVFVSRSDVERVSIVDGLVLSGRINPALLDRDPMLRSLVVSVPIGRSVRTEPEVSGPPASSDAELTIVWNGGLYEFHDPIYLLRVCEPLMESRKVRILFPFLPQGESAVKEDLLRFVASAPWAEQVSLGESTDQSVRGRLAFAVVGRQGVENTHCVRLRFRESCEWEVPLISDSLGATGDLLDREGIGLALSGDLRRAQMQLAEFSGSGYEAVKERLQEYCAREPFDGGVRDLAKVLSEVGRLVEGMKQ